MNKHVLGLAYSVLRENGRLVSDSMDSVTQPSIVQYLAASSLLLTRAGTLSIFPRTRWLADVYM